MKTNKMLLISFLTALSFAGCSEDDNIEYVNPGSKVKTDVVITDDQNLNDDYTNIADWSNRFKWNLANVHDPSVVLADDGYYYMYQTDASYGNAHVGEGQARGHFYCRRSKDLVNWEFMGPTMHGVPTWMKAKLNEIRKAMGLGTSTTDFRNQNQFGYWAPCVRRISKDLYRMYYVVTLPGTINGAGTWSERCFIGLMETKNPADIDSWVDKGYVVTNYSDLELNYKVSATDYAHCYFKYNAIDPSLIINEKGEHWLVYGSWHSGFAAMQLDPSTGKPLHALGNPWGKENEASYGKFIYTRQLGNRWQASEAPEVVYHDGYYYLFIAYDELSVAYNTRVVRSKNIDGPYYDITGKDVTNHGGDAYPILTHPYKFGNHHGWVGISHCAVFNDGKGNWYYASQQRFPENYKGNANSNALMLGGVRSIIWTSDGWPLVLPERYAGITQKAITETELLGDWQHINLAYHYKKQDASVAMTLGSDHKVKSGWKAGKAWTFDASKNVLTIDNERFYLRRELDWEANPRKETIVYVGLSKDGKTTYWGKKV
ncbi:arabinan endo-1,5-alpha-L-arabinosidase [Segatella oris]|uniref:Arabinan endo-1,5-alpha-L-arabinosidase n=1 Tax=Segatella oris TaxID=28135 RepID=A0A448L4Y1_9BACT|nr:arabinan endo-1,5-alpha-L-arabinosidase [Segatella oris]VEH15018.1 Arabinan endo-1,5-alpha-L-arabinosidase precursor [Segatella oris]